MKRLAVTMGDPAGVGPEVSLILMDEARRRYPDHEFIIYGDCHMLERVAEVVSLPPVSTGSVNHIPSLENPSAIVPGQLSADGGQASYDYLAQAIGDAMKGEIDAIVTAPINKEALRLAGLKYPGHTEILTELTGSKRSCMLQYSREVTASFVTCHCGYAEVPSLLTRERLREVIDLTHEALVKIRKSEPELLVLGLNPHAGEHGLFGDSEEERIIAPEVEAARKRGLRINGPVPPDTAFIPSMREKIDGYICMYHDQGHIPLKALEFYTAVNVTLGLPIIRTSVDHGTAYDIAWQGKASPGSIFCAAQLAVDMIS